VQELQAVYAAKGLLTVMERVGMDSPATCLKLPNDEKDGDASTTAVAYQKGRIFLRECEMAVGRERFDAFIQKYMKSFQFQSLSTEGFLDFLKTELPDVYEKVSVQKWVYEPGMPEEWHKPQSRLYDEVEKALEDYMQGKRPSREQVQDWHRYQILSFLQGLPKSIPVEDCKYFEDILELEKKNDGGFFSLFFVICVASGYQEAWPRVEEFMGTIGRMLYILPIMRAMIATDWTEDKARPLFEQVKNKHHLITVRAMDELLKKAGV